MIRLVLFLTAEYGWTLGRIHIRTAFFQAHGLDREVFSRPSEEANHPSRLWKLEAATYVLMDSGRLWYITSYHALVSEYSLGRLRYEPTLYYKITNGALVFVVVAHVGNYVLGEIVAEV